MSAYLGGISKCGPVFDVYILCEDSGSASWLVEPGALNQAVRPCLNSQFAVVRLSQPDRDVFDTSTGE